MSRLEKLAAEQNLAQRRARYWLCGVVGFVLLACYLQVEVNSAYGMMLAIFEALGCFVGAAICSQRERDAFNDFWLEAGLTPLEVDKKWQELYPSGD